MKVAGGVQYLQVFGERRLVAKSPGWLSGLSLLRRNCMQSKTSGRSRWVSCES